MREMSTARRYEMAVSVLTRRSWVVPQHIKELLVLMDKRPNGREPVTRFPPSCFSFYQFCQVQKGHLS